jgi:hypothetical protein
VTVRYKNETISFSDLDPHVHIETFKIRYTPPSTPHLTNILCVSDLTNIPIPSIDPSKTIAELSLDGGTDTGYVVLSKFPIDVLIEF